MFRLINYNFLSKRSRKNKKNTISWNIWLINQILCKSVTDFFHLVDLSIIHVNLISCSKRQGFSNIFRHLVLSRFATFCHGKNHEPPPRRRRHRHRRWTKTKGRKGGQAEECSPRQSLLQRYDIAAKRNHCSRSSSVSLPILSVLAQGWPNRSMNTKPSMPAYRRSSLLIIIYVYFFKFRVH